MCCLHMMQPALPVYHKAYVFITTFFNIDWTGDYDVLFQTS